MMCIMKAQETFYTVCRMWFCAKYNAIAHVEAHHHMLNTSIALGYIYCPVHMGQTLIICIFVPKK